MMHLHDDPFSTLDPHAPKPSATTTEIAPVNPWRDKLHELRQLEIEQEALAKRLKAIALRKRQILELSPAGHASNKRANKIAEKFGFSQCARSDP